MSKHHIQALKTVVMFKSLWVSLKNRTKGFKFLKRDQVILVFRNLIAMIKALYHDFIQSCEDRFYNQRVKVKKMSGRKRAKVI